MKFEVRNRLTGEVQFTADIECEEGAPTSIKLGLAVKWAVKARANLDGAYLAGANLAGANLAGAYLAGAYLARANLDGANLAGAYLARAYLADANLDGANLDGAYLARANLDGANLDGAKIKRLITTVQRVTDPYQFIAYDTDNGVRIVAGCRNFSPEEYRAHVAASYSGTPKAEETLAIIAFIEARAAAFLAPTHPEGAE